MAILEATAEMPHITERMIRMMQAFEVGGYQDLGEVVYDIAFEEEVLKTSASMRKLVEDYGQNQVAYLLLKTIPKDVIRSIILNRVAFDHTNSEAFRNQLPNADETAGVYLYTIGIPEQQGRFLNAVDTEKLVNLMEKYIRTQGKRDVQDAIRIESAFADAGRDVGGENARSGNRSLLSGRNGQDSKLLCRKLLERVFDRVDPSLHPIQAPCGVGYSKGLGSRIANHSSENRIPSTSKQWRLILSSLRVAEIKVKVVAIPVLKIWEEDQKQLAEILVTLLAGSMIEDGGLNAIAAGGFRDRDSENVLYEREKMETFVERNTLRDNHAEDVAQVAERRRDLEVMLEFEVGSPQLDIQAQGERFEAIEEETNRLIQGSHRISGDVEDAERRMGERLEELNAVETNLQDQYEFMEDIDAWLNS